MTVYVFYDGRRMIMYFIYIKMNIVLVGENCSYLFGNFCKKK